MTDREKCQAEQRAALETMLAGDTSPGIVLWFCDWLAEEALIAADTPTA